MHSRPMSFEVGVLADIIANMQQPPNNVIDAEVARRIAKLFAKRALRNRGHVLQYGEFLNRATMGDDL